MQHASACAARWVTDHAGLPFDVAKLPSTTKVSAPAREREPSWSAMWEPAVLLHLLRVALQPSHPDLTRAYAASLYLVIVASLRLVNGLRSTIPTLDDQNTFHGVAALSKGKRRSAMAPRLWCVPCVSPDPAFTDYEVAAGLQSSSAFAPAQKLVHLHSPAKPRAKRS